MSLLEWIGIISILVFIYQWVKNIYKVKHSEKFTQDPKFHLRQSEFKRMTETFEKLTLLRDADHDPHNESISNVQSALEYVILNTVPLPKNSFASDYLSKYVDYTVLHYLASSIIKSQAKNDFLELEELKINWE